MLNRLNIVKSAVVTYKIYIEYRILYILISFWWTIILFLQINRNFIHSQIDCYRQWTIGRFLRTLFTFNDSPFVSLSLVNRIVRLARIDLQPVSLFDRSRNVFNQHRWRFVSFSLVGSDRDEQQHYAEYRSVGVIESSPNPLLSLVFQRLLHHTRVFANCVLHTHIHATYEHTFNIYIYIYTSRNDGNLVTKDRPIKQIFTLPVSFNRRVQL